MRSGMVLAVSTLVLLLGPARQSSAQTPSAPISWSINGGFWRTDAGFNSTIQLKNRLITRGISAIPALFMADGTEYDLPVVYIPPSGVATIDVNAALASAPAALASHISSFGSTALRYGGMQSALLAQMAIGSTAISESFTSQFTSVKSGSSMTETLEGLWWAHDGGIGGFIAVTNAASQPRTLTVQMVNSAGKLSPANSVTLGPHESQMLDLLSLIGLPVHPGDAGGIHVQFDGLLGEMNVMGGLENRREGYSAVIPFWEAPMSGMNPSNSTATLAHPGIMVGAADPLMGFPVGTQFIPYLALRNLTASVQNVSLTFYTAQGTALAAPVQVLQAFESRQVDINVILQNSPYKTFSGDLTLTVSHAGGPNEVMSAAGSVDTKGTYVFEVNGRVAEQKVSKQSPYWSVKDGNDTMVALWNPGSVPEDVMVTFNYTGGSGKYHFRVHLAPHATANLGVKELIANQNPDENGNVLPRDVLEGNFVFHNADDVHGLLSLNVNVGVFNIKKGTCYYGSVWCDGYWGSLILDPSNLSMAPDDDAEAIVAYGQYDDGSTPGVNASFSSSNSSAATVSGGGGVGYVSPTGAGNTTITAIANLPQEGEYYGYNPSCEELQTNTTFTGTANVSVGDDQPEITGLTPTAWQAGATTTVTIDGDWFGTNAPTLNFSDPGISYTFSSYSDTEIVANVTVDPSKPDGVVSVSVTSNGYDGQGFAGNGNGQSAQSSSANAGTYHVWGYAEVTVIAWVNGDLISLPQYDNPELAYDLSYPPSCAWDVLQWSIGNRVQLTSGADVGYANAFLLKNSANAAPPASLTPSSFYTQRQSYRLFNDYGAPNFSGYSVGITPDPCNSGFIPNWLKAGQASTYNGATGVSSSGQFYQLAEGRLGKVGQAVNQTLNGLSTPWIWSVVEFNSSGAPTFSDVSMFPSFAVYVNGILNWTHTQSDVASFMQNDASYQRAPWQIN